MKEGYGFCWKCGKNMERSDGGKPFSGINIEVSIKSPVLPEDIAYYNKQLGKYSNGRGECNVSLCYECYIDGLFAMPLLGTTQETM